MKTLSVLDRLIGLARRNGELAATDPVTEVDRLAAALEELASERRGAEEAIETASAAKAALLLEPGSDARMDGLEREINLSQRTLDRLDVIEPLLLQQLRDRREAYKSRHFDALRERFKGAVAEYAEVMRRGLVLRSELVGLQASAERAGFAEARFLFEPPFLQCCNPDHYERNIVDGLERSISFTEPERVQIRFSRPCGLYRADEVAGFLEAEAVLYINAGVAERVVR